MGVWRDATHPTPATGREQEVMSPKEYVHSRDFDRVFTDEATGGPIQQVDRTAVRVSWSREQDNVAMVIVDKAKDPDGQDANIWWLNLDRRGCNHLIRVLRSARDGAFGKDA